MDHIYGRMDVAVTYGLEVSVFINVIFYWLEKNASINENFIDGRYWAYHSLNGFSKMLPVWSRDQVKRIIGKCKDAGLLLTGDYNENPYTHTKWYALSDKALEIYGVEVTPEGLWRKRHIEGENRHIDVCENATCRQGESAISKKSKEEREKKKDTPYSPPDEKAAKQTKYDLAEDAKPILREYVGEDKELARYLGDMIENRKELKAINSKRAIKALLGELERLSNGSRANKVALLRRAISAGWKTVYPMRPDELPDKAPPGGPPAGTVVERGEVPTW